MKRRIVIVGEPFSIKKELYLGKFIHQIKYSHAENNKGTYTFLNKLYFKNVPSEFAKSWIEAYINKNGLTCGVDKYGNLYITREVEFEYRKDGWYIVWEVTGYNKTTIIDYESQY